MLGKLFMPERKATLKKLKTPGLVIFGEHEMLFNSHKAAARINQTMPTLKATVIPNTGHSAMYDQPELVNPIILDFLQSD